MWNIYFDFLTVYVSSVYLRERIIIHQLNTVINKNISKPKHFLQHLGAKVFDELLSVQLSSYLMREQQYVRSLVSSQLILLSLKTEWE